MVKCLICNKEIQRDSIPCIEPKIDNVMLNKDNQKHPICDACGNLLSVVLKMEEGLSS